jgi:hypothetical protein
MANDISVLYAQNIRKAPDPLPSGVSTKREWSMLQLIELRKYQEELGLADFNRDLQALKAQNRELERRIIKLENGGGSS